MRTKTLPGWKIEINNRLRCLGRCDYDTRTIYINTRLHMREKVHLHTTLIHEYLHALHPQEDEHRIEYMSNWNMVSPEEWDYLSNLFIRAHKKWSKTHRPLIPIKKRMRRVLIGRRPSTRTA